MDQPPLIYRNIPIWLPKVEYDKATGQAGFEILQHLKIFDKYGMGIYIPGTQAALVRVCEDFGLRVRGIDHPIHVDPSRHLEAF